jgi:hypothetical protein
MVGGSFMQSLQGWAFMSLMGCLLFVTLSLLPAKGTLSIALAIVGVVLGILSGGLYAASVGRSAK